MKDALRGLRIVDGILVPDVVGARNPRGAIAVAERAEESLRTENIAFKAAAIYRDAILMDPDCAHAYLGLARCLTPEGDRDLARAALNAALLKDPDLHTARDMLAALAQMAGEYREAVRLWRDLAERSPSFPEVYARLAIASYYAEDYVAARSWVIEADRRRQSVPPQFRGLLAAVKAP